jgi:hypothetical protein
MKIPNFGYHFARWEAISAQNLPYLATGNRLPKRAPIAPSPVECLLLFWGDHAARTGPVYSHFPAPCGSPEELYRDHGRLALHAEHRAPEKDRPVVSIRPAGEHLPRDLPEKFRHYVTTYPMGKQLGLIMSLPRNGPALYVDSDVLFFPGAAKPHPGFHRKEAPAFYLPDCQDCSADSRILLGPSEALQPVNSGVLMLLRHSTGHLASVAFSSWKESRTFSPTRHCAPRYACQWRFAARRDKVCLQLDDQFIYPDRHASPLPRPAPLCKSGSPQILDDVPALMKSPGRPLRILAIVNLPWDSRLGASRVWIELAKEWTRAGHSVERFCLTDAYPQTSVSGAGRPCDRCSFREKPRPTFEKMPSVST